jgi:hypothetical protein
MPVDREVFDRVKYKQSLILRFLYEHRDQAFNTQEIDEVLKMDRLQVHITGDIDALVKERLVESEVINHIVYYAIAQRGVDVIEEKA